MADSIVAEHAMKRRSNGSCDKCSKAIARGPPGGMRKVANLAGKHESIAIGGIGFAGAGGLLHEPAMACSIVGESRPLPEPPPPLLDPVNPDA